MSFWVDGPGGSSGTLPSGLCYEPCEAGRYAPQDGLCGERRCRRHSDFDLTFHFDDPGGDFDDAQWDGVELKCVPDRFLRHLRAQAPHQAIGGRMQEHPKLVGGGFGAGGPVSGHMGLPRLDMVFRLSAREIGLQIANISMDYATSAISP